MLLCNYLVDVFIPTTTMHDVVVELRIGEAQIVLVCLTTKTVRRSLVYQLTGNGEFVANLTNLMYHDVCEWAEVTSAVTELCGVSNIILGAITGVCDATSASQRLSDHIKRRHTQPWREIDRCLITYSRRHYSADHINHLAVCTANVNCDTCNAKRIWNLLWRTGM